MAPDLVKKLVQNMVHVWKPFFEVLEIFGCPVGGLLGPLKAVLDGRDALRTLKNEKCFKACASSVFQDFETVTR